MHEVERPMSFRSLSGEDQHRLFVIYVVTDDRDTFVKKVRLFKSFAELRDGELHEIWEVLGEFDANYTDLVEA
jgi:hypothetical protein